MNSGSEVKALLGRRDFVTASTAAGLGAATGTAAGAANQKVSARSASRVLGANDRINMSIIGVGGIGTARLRLYLEKCAQESNIQVVAVSDVYSMRRERARGLAKLSPADVYVDYRDLLARPDVDAVEIATPDHWHARMALDALAAGKDVYLQKPMTYTVEEARQVAEAAAKSDRILQVGSQGLSAPATHKAKELIQEGAIGELLWAQDSSSRNSVHGEWNWRIEPEGTPETIDWDRWLGSAPKRPFSAERFFRFRKYWDYSGGIATDLFYHRLGPLLFAMGPRLPICVTACGGIYVQKDREVPDTYATQIEYPEFYISLSGSMANAAGGTYHGAAIYGHEGTIKFEGASLVVTPEKLDKARAPQPKVYEYPEADGRARHFAHASNFFDCMRSRKAPNLPAELGYQIMAAIGLGVESYRQRRAVLFDQRTGRRTDELPERPRWEGDGKNYT
jgi:predicted dehydrogenase